MEIGCQGYAGEKMLAATVRDNGCQFTGPLTIHVSLKMTQNVKFTVAVLWRLKS